MPDQDGVTDEGHDVEQRVRDENEQEKRHGSMMMMMIWKMVRREL